MLASGTLSLPAVMPGERLYIEIPDAVTRVQSNKEVHLTISVSLGHDTCWAGTDHEVAWFQGQMQPRAKTDADSVLLNRLSSDLRVSSEGPALTVSGVNFAVQFDQIRGVVQSWTVNNLQLLEMDPISRAALRPSFWRPATDNDVPQSLPYWQRFGVDALTSQLRSLQVETSQPDAVIVRVHTFISPPSLSWGFNCEMDYTISNTGLMRVNVTRLAATGPAPDHVPRIGLDLRLNKHLEQVKWFGRGPGESYPDKKASQRIGIWAVDSVADLHTPYDVPQENGNRLDTRWVELKTCQPTPSGIRARRIGQGDDATFSFAASRYSTQDVHAARHPNDLVEQNATLLRLDAQVSGVGSGACGPAVREDLMVKCQETSFVFELEPF
jgi:beta-galactosidase